MKRRISKNAAVFVAIAFRCYANKRKNHPSLCLHACTLCRIRKYHIGRNWECVKTIPTETSIFHGNVISADRLCISLQSRQGFELKLAMNSFLCRLKLSPAGIEIFLEIQLVSRIVSALISTSGSSRANHFRLSIFILLYISGLNALQNQ